jgi:aminoglycoside 6'-N-acetyltransferase
VTAVELVGDQVVLRPATAADGPRFTEIVATDEVQAWWGDGGEGAGDTTSIVRELLAPDQGTTTWAVLRDGAVIGFVQSSEVDDPQYRSAGIDIALHPGWHGRGLGTDTVRTLARHLVHDRGHHRLTIDPAVANSAAIAAYRKVGFRDVGVLRRYERGLDGTYHDGLLMDLLADELT